MGVAVVTGLRGVRGVLLRAGAAAALFRLQGVPLGPEPEEIKRLLMTWQLPQGVTMSRRGGRGAMSRARERGVMSRLGGRGAMSRARGARWRWAPAPACRRGRRAAGWRLGPGRPTRGVEGLKKMTGTLLCEMKGMLLICGVLARIDGGWRLARTGHSTLWMWSLWGGRGVMSGVGRRRARWSEVGGCTGLPPRGWLAARTRAANKRGGRAGVWGVGVGRGENCLPPDVPPHSLCVSVGRVCAGRCPSD